MSRRFKLHLRNASQVVRICTSGARVKLGKQDMNEIEMVENTSIVIDQDGRIAAIGTPQSMDELCAQHSVEKVIDVTGKVVIPGLCDAHQHPVFSGDRVHEFAMKLAGASYMELHEKGAGIGFTVECVRKSTEQDLIDLLVPRLDRMLAKGTTLVEAKSGYGLDTENEIKMLRVLHRVNQMHPIDIISNYCGAHSLPKGMSSEEATLDVILNQIPAVLKGIKAGEISPTLIDVFCEKGVYTVEQTRKILQAGKQIGLDANFHGEELNYLGSVEMGAQIGTLAISHLECISEQGIQAMAEKEIIAVILPTTAYILRLEVPPARQLIDRGAPVALGSDFNPNAYCYSMSTVMHLACVTMRLTMPEALCAATLNAAASMNVSNDYGSIEVGKYGDLVIVDAPTWEHFIYRLSDPPIDQVIKRGTVVYSATK